MHCVRRTCVVAATLLALAGACLAADWPQYRGPASDGKTPEPIRTDWAAVPPKVLWKVPAGVAFGTFAVVGERAYVFDGRSGDEGVRCLDAASGEEKWFTKIGKTTGDRQGGPGPRTTPTIVGDKLYVLSTYFNLVCLNAADGKQAWAHDLAREHAGQNDTNGIVQWGNAGSPIFEGDLVIVAGGGANQTFLAFNKDDGKLVWKSGSEKVTHATGTPATIHGVRQVIFFVQSGLVSIEPKTGRELWRAKHPFNVSTAASPVVGGDNGDIVYCASAYNVGSAAFQISKQGDTFSASELWRLKGNENANHWMTPVHHQGLLYGLYGHRGRGPAQLQCREISTGEVKWSQPAQAGAGGAVSMAGGKLIVQHEDGKIVVVDPNPAGYKPIAEAQPLKGKAWSMAVVSNGRMFVRTDKEAAALEVAAERSAAAQ